MGAEESRMYPGHEGSSTSHQGQSAGTRATYAGTRQQTVQRNPPTILPQPVLLVGYTPEGAPILMSNTAQNTVSQMTTHSTSTHAPVFDQQSAVAPSLTTGTVAVTGPPQASHMTNEMMTNLLQTQTPVLAVPVTILGPDGKPVTALVKPTSNQQIGAQVIERGIISTGGTYQLVREPNGTIVRHVFHDKGNTATNQVRTVQPANSATSTSTAAYPGSSHSRTNQSTGTASPYTGTTARPSSAVNTVSPPSAAPLSSSTSTLRSSYSSTNKPTPSPPHPTVQSTADFLRQNSSLDTSYGSTSSTSSEPRLLNYVSWESDIAKVPTKDASAPTATTKPVASPAPPQDTTPAIYPDLDKSSTEVKTQEVSTNHTPSKALKYHYSHGGDKGLVDVNNPYEDL